MLNKRREDNLVVLFLEQQSHKINLMTLALLVYAIAQRQLDQALKNLEETLRNQIGKETAKPTLRWIFQLLDGIYLVKMDIKKVLMY